MTNPVPAVKLEASTHRQYIQNNRGLIDLRVTNIDPADSVTAQVELVGDLVGGEWADIPRMLAPTGTTTLKIPVTPSSKGDFLQHVRVKLELADGSLVYYTGEFDLNVEAEATDPKSIHVNITNEVSGTGFIDASDLKIPSIHKPATPDTQSDRFTEVLLCLDPFSHAMSKCILKEMSSPFQLHVLTESQVTIGRHAEQVDISVPEPNDRISRAHCRLERTQQGICLQNLSTTNPPRLDAVEVRECAHLPISEISTLELGNQATYQLHPIPASDLHSRVLKHLTQRGHNCRTREPDIKGLAALAIIPESDSHACNELILWLFQSVPLQDIPKMPSGSNAFSLASIPSIAIVESSESGKIRSVRTISEHQRIGPFVIMR